MQHAAAAAAAPVLPTERLLHFINSALQLAKRAAVVPRADAAAAAAPSWSVCFTPSSAMQFKRLLISDAETVMLQSWESVADWLLSRGGVF